MSGAIGGFNNTGTNLHYPLVLDSKKTKNKRRVTQLILHPLYLTENSITKGLQLN